MAESPKKYTTREKIIKTANRLFFEEGYTKTAVSRIAKEMEISNGNLTFHFPTKEHLLLELVKVMCSFQWDLTLHAAQELGLSPLLAYGLEITLQTAACETSEIARDFYVSSYTHPLTLAEIRDWDSRKAQKLFAAYNPDWTEVDFRRTEEIASGIEVAVIMEPCEDKITLDEKIACTLHNLMKIYNIPMKESDEVIRHILSMDYQAIAESMLQQYKECIEFSGEIEGVSLTYDGILVQEGEDTK